jgi:hypothetical protein
MRALVILAAGCFSVSAHAQDAPKIGSKPLMQVKPKEANELQTFWNGQGYQAVGWRLCGTRGRNVCNRNPIPV